MSEVKIEVGSLWRPKDYQGERVREVLYADERTVAYRQVEGVAAGYTLPPVKFLDVFEPVPPSPPEVEPRWVAVRPDGSVMATRTERHTAIRDAKWCGAVGIVRVVPDMDTWEAL